MGQQRAVDRNEKEKEKVATPPASQEISRRQLRNGLVRPGHRRCVDGAASPSRRRQTTGQDAAGFRRTYAASIRPRGPRGGLSPVGGAELGRHADTHNTRCLRRACEHDGFPIASISDDNPVVPSSSARSIRPSVEVHLRCLVSRLWR